MGASAPFQPKPFDLGKNQPYQSPHAFDSYREIATIEEKYDKTSHIVKAVTRREDYSPTYVDMARSDKQSINLQPNG